MAEQDRLASARQKWEALSNGWSDSGPPSAPSQGDLACYLWPLQRGVSRFLILGCTPRLRSSIAEAGAGSTSVDVTPEMLEVSARQFPAHSTSHLVLGDWLHLPLPDSSLDAVVGDKVFGNIAPDDWDRFAAEIWRVLRPRGESLTRATPHGSAVLEIPDRGGFEDILARWTSRYEAGMSLDAACSGLWEECMDASTLLESPQAGTQSLARSLPGPIASLAAKHGATSAERELVQMFVERFSPTTSAVWSAYSHDGLIAAFSSGFEFAGRYVADDYPDAHEHPIFQFLRR